MLTGEGLVAVHLNAQPPVRMAPRFGLFADIPAPNAVLSAPLPVFALDDCAAAKAPECVKRDGDVMHDASDGGDDDESSTGEAGDRLKRPLRRVDKRKKIRRVNSRHFARAPVFTHTYSHLQIRGDASLPSVTREAHLKEMERIRKQKELEDIEILARRQKEPGEIIDISSGDEAVGADPSAAAPQLNPTQLGPLVCTVQSERVVVNIEMELSRKLKHHQMEGVKFMWGHLSDAEGFGCILADEMGLGKTLTSLVTLHALALAGICKNALVVCPSLVISTWTEQTEKWLPQSCSMSRVCAISPEVPASKRFSKLQTWADGGGLCIIGYEMFREICGQPDSPIAELLTATPDVVIADEGDK